MATDIPSSTPFGGSDAQHWDEPWILTGPGGRHSSAVPESLTDTSRDIPGTVQADLASRGLSARSRTLADDCFIRRAENLIQLVPSLAQEVLRLVDSLFILDIPDPCYDQSHSEPAYPGMVLVSLPPSDEVGALRLAEGIVHEAMHLNLSESEQRVPLVAGEARLYSPWRQGERSASGVLHGAYVFACVRRFLKIVSPSLDDRLARHATKRQNEIQEEAANVDWVFLADHLTPRGIALLKEIRLACAS